MKRPTRYNASGIFNEAALTTGLIVYKFRLSLVVFQVTCPSQAVRLSSQLPGSLRHFNELIKTQLFSSLEYAEEARFLEND